MNFPSRLLTLLLFVCSLFGHAQDKVPSVISDITFLASDELEGRESGTTGNEKAREYLLKRFELLGLEKMGDSFIQPFTFSVQVAPDSREVERMSGKNLIGMISGQTDKYIVITAHYDHLGVMDGKIHNGADDNASGTAGLLSIAAHFSKNKPVNNLIFCAFDAEEKGLQGAKHFVGNLEIPKASILLNVNMDMISRSDKNVIYACGTSYNPQFKPLLKKSGKASPVKLKFGHDNPKLGTHDWTFSSDHGPFHSAGIPFVYFGVEDHEDYHRYTDDSDKIKPEFVQNTVNLVTDFVSRIDQQEGN